MSRVIIIDLGLTRGLQKYIVHRVFVLKSVPPSGSDLSDFGPESDHLLKIAPFLVWKSSKKSDLVRFLDPRPEPPHQFCTIWGDNNSLAIDLSSSFSADFLPVEWTPLAHWYSVGPIRLIERTGTAGTLVRILGLPKMKKIFFYHFQKGNF